MFEKYYNFRCLDWECVKHLEEELSSRYNFYQHAANKPTSRLYEIVDYYHIVKFPKILDRYSLLNLVTDYSKEPVASEIIRIEKE